MMENISDKVESAIEACDSKLMRTLSRDIESELLLESKFPEWCFELFTKLFKDDRFCTVPGTEHFVWVIYNDFEKLSTRQVDFLFELLTIDYGRFKNKKLLHSLADFIARKYPSYLSLKAFQYALNEGSETSRYFALVGSEIIAVNKNSSEKEKIIAATLIKKISGEPV